MPGIPDVLDKLDEVLVKIAEVLTAVESDKRKHSICYHCGGDGVKGGVEGSCPDCEGSGYIFDGKISKD